MAKVLPHLHFDLYDKREGVYVDPLKHVNQPEDMNLPDNWVEYLRLKPEGAVDPYAGRPHAAWDIRRDFIQIILKIGQSENDRKRIVKDGMDFKKELWDAFHDSRFLDWYLQDPWVQKELEKRGIYGSNQACEKKLADIRKIVDGK